MAKHRKYDDTTVRLPSDFEATLGALIRTPPPPAGDPSTRKQKPKSARKKQPTPTRKKGR